MTKKTGTIFQPSGSVPQSAAPHQAQYGKHVAEFFDVFNQMTGRRELYQGYLAGYLGQQTFEAGQKHIAVDFGCGTGWLVKNLTQYSFSNVVGIDTSQDMLGVARKNVKTSAESAKAPVFYTSVPAALIGKCCLVTAVHVHYHFTTTEELRNNFFGNISSLLKEGGESILIGCPSDYINRTPPHYQNSVHYSDIPSHYLEQAKDVLQKQDAEGYVPLSELPVFPLRDGTQMKVALSVREPSGTLHSAVLKDSFWSDKALIKAAKAANLELTCRRNLSSGDHPNAYMVLHFKKRRAPRCAPKPTSPHL